REIALANGIRYAYRQRARPRRTDDPVPRVRRGPDRTRWLRARSLGSCGRGAVRPVRDAVRGGVRGRARALGRPPAAGPARPAMSPRVRPPAVAGSFYPAGPEGLARAVDRLLAAA